MEVTLTDFILKLKASKQFVTTVKNALRLIGSLQERDLSVLYELFPWIGEAIRADLKTPSGTPDTGDLEDRLAARIDSALQEALLHAPSLPATNYPLMKPSSAPPKVETKAAPIADAGTIADNFLAFIQ